MSSWWLLLGLAGITFLNRFAFFARSLRYQPGARTLRFLSYSSYAILTAIWTPIVFQFTPGQGVQIAGYDYLLAALVAAILTLNQIRSIVVVLVSTLLFFVLRSFTLGWL